MCTSSKLCGKIEKHPDEKPCLNLLKKEEREVRKEMNKLEKEIIVKTQTAESVRSRIVYEVRDSCGITFPCNPCQDQSASSHYSFASETPSSASGSMHNNDAMNLVIGMSLSLQGDHTEF